MENKHIDIELENALISFREKQCNILSYSTCVKLKATDDWVHTETIYNENGEAIYFLKRQILYLDNDEKENFATVDFYGWDTSEKSCPGIKTTTIINEISPIEHGTIEKEN